MNFLPAHKNLNGYLVPKISDVCLKQNTIKFDITKSKDSNNQP